MEADTLTIIGILVTIGGIIITFLFKINRCIGRHEGEIKGLRESLDRIAKSLLSHLDKK